MSNLLHAHIFRIFIFSWRIKPFSMQYQFLSLVIFLILKTTLTSPLSFSQWSTFLGVPGLTSGKQSAYQCRRLRDMGLIPGLGRCPGGGHGNLLQYACLENPMDRGAWWARVHGVAESGTQPKQLSTPPLYFYPISYCISSDILQPEQNQLFFFYLLIILKLSFNQYIQIFYILQDCCVWIKTQPHNSCFLFVASALVFFFPLYLLSFGSIIYHYRASLHIDLFIHTSFKNVFSIFLQLPQNLVLNYQSLPSNSNTILHVEENDFTAVTSQFLSPISWFSAGMHYFEA